MKVLMEVSCMYSCSYDYNNVVMRKHACSLHKFLLCSAIGRGVEGGIKTVTGCAIINMTLCRRRSGN